MGREYFAPREKKEKSAVMFTIALIALFVTTYCVAIVILFKRCRSPFVVVVVVAAAATTTINTFDY